MGYQNGNDNSQQTANESADKRSHQRTSKVSELANNTTKCQYDRLGKTGPTDQGTK